MQMNNWIFTMYWGLLAFLFWFGTFTPSEGVALVATFLVFIGVAGEYVIEVPVVEKKARLKSWIKRLSILLLLVGLAGELLGVVMGQAEMAILTREAAGAATSASRANEAALSAQRAGKQLYADLKRERGERVVAESRISGEQQKAAAAQKGAAEAQQQLNNFLFEHSFNRTLKFDLASALKVFPPASAEILYEDDDAEAWKFADTIRNGLLNAGWTVPPLIAAPPPRFNGNDLVIYGVQIFHDRKGLWTSVANEQMTEFTLRHMGLSEVEARRLAILMAAVGAHALSEDKKLPPGDFRIVVGPRVLAGDVKE